MARNTVTIGQNGDQSLAKDQEQQILDEIRDALAGCGETYLASLFSEELVSWAKMRIDQDLPPDIWTEYRDALKTVGEINDDLMTRRAELENKGRVLQVALNENKELKQKVDALTHDVVDLEDARAALADLEAQNEELTREHKKAASDAWGAKNRLAEAEQTILRLKARLYDLEHPEPAGQAGDQNLLLFPCQAIA